MRFGDTFHEHWSTRSGPVALDWLVIACERPRLWIGLTHMSATGPIVVQDVCTVVDGGTKFTRTVRNPARGSMRKRSWDWGISRGRWRRAWEQGPIFSLRSEIPFSGIL
jgi:hypothetical protein